MKFYEFTENNSVGRFDVDDKLCHRVIIEANSLDSACDIAERLGIYFDGCATGSDCDCCGDRWYRPWSDDGFKLPYTYSSFKYEDAHNIAKIYGCDLIPAKKVNGDRDTDLSFKTIESYAQYLADNHGWTIPECRIYFSNGDVTEINIAVKKKQK